MGRLKGVGSRRHLTSGDACRSKNQKEVFYQPASTVLKQAKRLKQKWGGEGRGTQASAVDRFRKALLLVRERYIRGNSLGDFQGCRQV